MRATTVPSSRARFPRTDRLGCASGPTRHVRRHTTSLELPAPRIDGNLVPFVHETASEFRLDREGPKHSGFQVEIAMAKPKILHMFDPRANVSPFDVNMAVDAGYQVVVPYSGTGVDDVTGLVQDAIFSRPPGRYNETGVFIGGHDVNLAVDMLDRARGAMVGPFEVAVMADPNGAYTTSAALVALIEKRAWRPERRPTGGPQRADSGRRTGGALHRGAGGAGWWAPEAGAADADDAGQGRARRALCGPVRGRAPMGHRRRRRGEARSARIRGRRGVLREGRRPGAVRGPDGAMRVRSRSWPTSTRCRRPASRGSR